MDWKDLPRTKDRLIMVGMNPNTRDNAPWNDETAEIWVLNEMTHFDKIKRWDRVFQLHARWDFMRTNNLNDPNYPLWLTNKSDTCLFCKGTARIGLDGKEITCPECKDGIYTPPADRMGRPIYMQEVHPDIPGSVAYPLDYLTQKYCPDNTPYFTSTFSMMFVLAMELGFKEIILYGFEMGSDTEYHYQRVCGEYWMGYARGLGFKVEAPGSGLMRGELYGFNNMRLGFRQLLEVRKTELKSQMTAAWHEVMKAEGMVIALTPYKDTPTAQEDYKLAVTHHGRTKMFWNFLNGTKTEIDNLIPMYDTYFVEHNQKNQEETTKHIGMKYQMGK